MTEDDWVLPGESDFAEFQGEKADTETVEWKLSPALVGEQVGPYRLLKQIGKGGMGTIYLAEQTEPIRRRVALKIVKPDIANESLLARFDVERNALALMNHPNIARVLDAGLDDEGHPYFVMELVSGLPITEYCDRHKLGIRERARLMVTVCCAVQHAHQKGIVHRDIKPGNVLIMDSDGKPEPKIIDFGIAKAIENQDLQTPDTRVAGIVVGTPLYMSPEQAGLANYDIDTRSDVYSLGVLFYELLTGTTPITDSQVRKVVTRDHRLSFWQKPPPAPSERLGEQRELLPKIAELRGTSPRALVQAVRHDLDQIVTKATAKDRNDRYPTANGLARDIERYLNGQPIEAVTPSALQLFHRFARRNRGKLATICLVVCLLLTATIVSIRQAYLTDAALRDAEALSKRLAELLFISDIKVASDAWKYGDPPRVADLLARHVPLPGEKDHRRFEWYYLSQLVHLDCLQVDLATDRMKTIRYSPDGKYLAAGDEAGIIHLYDAGSLTPIATIESEQGGVSDLAFSPGGKTLATAGKDGTIRLWDIATRQLRHTIQAHDDLVCGIAYAAEGRFLVSCSLDTRIRIWDAVRGTQEGELLGHERGVEALAVGPDGWLVASASDDATIRLWDLKKNTQIDSIRFSNARMVCVAFSGDGRFVAGGDIHGNLILHDRTSGQSRILTTLLDGIESVVFLNKDRWLATGDRGGAIQFWPVESEEGRKNGSPQDSLPRWQAHRSRVTALAVAPDGLHLLSGSRNGRIRQWSTQPKNCRWTIGGPSDPAEDFVFLDDQNDYLVVASTASLDLWNLATHRRSRSWGAGQAPWLNTAISPDRKVLVAGKSDGSMIAWQLDTFTEVARWPSPASVPWQKIVFSPNGHTFAAVAWDRLEEVWLFDLDDPEWSRPLPARQSKFVAFSRDGRQLAVAWMDDAVVYDLATYQEIHRFHGHSSTLSDLAFAPNQDFLATVGHDRRLRLWNSLSAAEKYSVAAHRDWARAVTFSPDGWSLATAGDDGVLRFWHTESGQLLLELADEGENIFQLQYGPTGRRLACRTAGGRIIVYDSRHPANK